MFSIIICLYVISPRFYIDIQKYKKLVYKKYEIILVTEKNAHIAPLNFPHRIIRAKKKRISLGEKRDIGLSAARGEFCAYIDDDAYPDPHWLTEAYKILRLDKQLGAVGGPNLTPTDEPFWSTIGGYIYESYLTSGEAQYRFLPKSRREVLELQGVNLIIRRSALKKIGGFQSKLSSGEDSKVCSDLRKAKYKIIYDPLIAVYHHRRAFPKGHLRQIRNMGTHRGFFVKAYPNTLSLIYFLPFFLACLFFIGLFASFFNKMIAEMFIIFVLVAFLIAYLSSLQRAGPVKSCIVAAGIIMTHIVYGIFFVYGFFLKTIEK